MSGFYVALGYCRSLFSGIMQSRESFFKLSRNGSPSFAPLPFPLKMAKKGGTQEVENASLKVDRVVDAGMLDAGNEQATRGSLIDPEIYRLRRISDPIHLTTITSFWCFFVVFFKKSGVISNDIIVDRSRETVCTNNMTELLPAVMRSYTLRL